MLPTLMMFLALLFLAPSANALQLSWTNNRTDISMAHAGTCTLQVHFQPGQRTPGDGLRLSYVVEGGPAPVLLPAASTIPYIEVGCEIVPPRDLAGRMGMIDTLVACGPAEHQTARYVFLVEPNTRVSLRATLEGDHITESNVATINGGTLIPLPPVLVKASVARSANRCTATLHGTNLGGVTAVSYLSRLGVQIASPAILSTQNDRIDLVFSDRPPLPPGLFRVATAQGATTAIPFDGESGHGQLDWAPDRILVRFRESHVHPPLHRTGGALSEFQYARSDAYESLLDAGVERMERLLPWFTPEDVRAVDVRGDSVTLADLSTLYLAHLQPNTEVSEAIARIRANSAVLYAHPDMKIHGMLNPNDPLYATDQWGLHYTGNLICGLFQGDPSVNAFAPTAWDRTTGSSSVRIAIIDSGIDRFHPEFSGRLDPGISFVSGFPDPDDDSCTSTHDYLCHGTAVAGIAAATGNNGLGIAGLDWQARIVPIKVLSASGQGFTSALISAIDWTREQRIPIANMSLGYFEGVPSTTTAALSEVCLNAFRSGVLLIAASGNVTTIDDFDDATTAAYPAALHQRVTAVGAILPNAGSSQPPGRPSVRRTTTSRAVILLIWARWPSAARLPLLRSLRALRHS